jgi:hypothetical protein
MIVPRRDKRESRCLHREIAEQALRSATNPGLAVAVGAAFGIRSGLCSDALHVEHISMRAASMSSSRRRWLIQMSLNLGLRSEPLRVNALRCRCEPPKKASKISPIPPKLKLQSRPYPHTGMAVAFVHIPLLRVGEYSYASLISLNWLQLRILIVIWRYRNAAYGTLSLSAHRWRLLRRPVFRNNLFLSSLCHT